MCACQQCNCRLRRTMSYYDRGMRYYDRGLGRGRLRGLRGLGQAGDIPAGSQLTYTCQFTPSLDPLNSSFYGMGNTIAAVTAALQSQWNISVLNYQDNTPITSTSTAGPVTLNLQTMADYGAVADVKSVIDGAFYNAAGATIVSSTLAINTLASPGSASALTNIGTGTAVQAASAQLPFDLGNWLTDNWIYLAGGILGAVALKEVL